MGLKPCQQRFERLEIVVGEVLEALHHGFKPLVIARLARRTDCSQGSTMKTGACRQDDRPFNATHGVAMLSRQLDGGFVGLCS